MRRRISGEVKPTQTLNDPIASYIMEDEDGDEKSPMAMEATPTEARNDPTATCIVEDEDEDGDENPMEVTPTETRNAPTASFIEEDEDIHEKKSLEVMPNETLNAPTATFIAEAEEYKKFMEVTHTKLIEAYDHAITSILEDGDEKSKDSDESDGDEMTKVVTPSETLNGPTVTFVVEDEDGEKKDAVLPNKSNIISWWLSRSSTSMAPQEQDSIPEETGVFPSFKTMEKAMELPIVNIVVNVATKLHTEAATYPSVNQLENNIVGLLTKAEGIITPCIPEPITSKIYYSVAELDTLACSGLNKVIAKVPALKQPPGELALVKYPINFVLFFLGFYVYILHTILPEDSAAPTGSVFAVVTAFLKTALGYIEALKTMLEDIVKPTKIN